MTDSATAVRPPATGMRGFFDRGGFWRLLVLVAVYLAIYLASGWAIAKLLPDTGRGSVLDSVANVVMQLTFALLVGAVVLSVFTRYMGWNAELYGRQPIYRSWWMWLGPIVALVPIGMRAFGIDWGRHPVSVVAMVIASGLLIGFVEELLCRGIGVKMLRTAGHAEFAVAALTSLVFGLLHATNLLSGAALLPTLAQIFYTFGFGVLMYLTMRVTGFLVVAMVLHGLTDPLGILATGGVSEIAAGTTLNGLLFWAGQLTVPIGLVGLILLMFVRGKVQTAGDGTDA